MNKLKFTKIFIYLSFSIVLLFLIPDNTHAGCSGTPTACSSLVQGNCPTCGCTWNPTECTNSGACSSNSAEGACTACSCAGCSWGGSSCPWVASWDGEEWVLEHEAFPFAAFAGAKTTTWDSLTNVKCIDGEAKIKIYEGLPEITYLSNFKLYQVDNSTEFIKPDLNGKVRTIAEKIPPNSCSTSNSSEIKEDCLDLITKHDENFWEPKFNKEKIDDWLIVEFDNIESKSNKLYMVAREQIFLTTYSQYMTHILGEDRFQAFSQISKWPIINNIISKWWDENLKMQVEVWDGEEWQRQGVISAGHHLPGSGADDFLISIEKLDKEIDTLKVRFRFLTAGFGIDYIYLDSTEDSEVKIKKLLPESVTFNEETVEYATPRKMVYDDSLVLSYSCTGEESFFFSIEGYYIPDDYPPEREKKGICAWQEFIALFLSGKEYVVDDAHRKGLYKEAICLNDFTAEEIEAQQKVCFLYYIMWGGFILLLALLLILYLWKKKKRSNPFVLLLFFIVSLITLITLKSIPILATSTCRNTIDCSNCLEAGCNSCSQCTWVTANCSGTPNACSTHNNQSACTTCGCTWEDNTAPSFSVFNNNGPKDPGSDITFTTTSSDPNGDNVKLVVCKTQGVTGTACDGGSSDTWCTSSLVASNPSCSYSIPTPTLDTTYNVYPYVFDTNDLGSESSLQGTLDTYTISNVAPTVTNVTINGGSTINLNAGTTKAVNITGAVTDNNSCEDISSVTAYAYRSSIGYSACDTSGEANSNYCYPEITCTVDTGTCTGSTDASAIYTCTVDLQYFADPTDTNTQYPNDTWLSTIKATDNNSATGTAHISQGVELNSLMGFNITTEINYGSLGVGESNDPLDKTTTITPTGNIGLDHEVYGPANMCTDFPTCSGSTIAIGHQKYALSSSTSYSSATALTTTETTVSTNVPKPTSTSPSTKSIWWGMLVPELTDPGTYDGSITITGMKSAVANW